MSWSQFHQHFKSSFSALIFLPPKSINLNFKLKKMRTQLSHETKLLNFFGEIYTYSYKLCFFKYSLYLPPVPSQSNRRICRSVWLHLALVVGDLYQQVQGLFRQGFFSPWLFAPSLAPPPPSIRVRATSLRALGLKIVKVFSYHAAAPPRANLIFAWKL